MRPRHPVAARTSSRTDDATGVRRWPIVVSWSAHAAGSRSCTSMPPTVIEPDRSSTRLRHASIRVDLPTPLGPYTAVIVPGATSRSSPLDDQAPTASELEVANDDGAVRRGGCVADRQRRSREQLVEIVGRVQSRLGGVEARPDPTQRQVALGRQQQDDERRAEVEAATCESQADLDGDQCHRQGGDQLQCQRRQECDPQCAHRRGPVLLGHVVDRPRLCLGTTEQAQGGHSLEHVEEVAAETLEDGPLAFGAALRHPADQHHEHGDQRHGQCDQHRRQQVGEEDADPGDQRDRQRQQSAPGGTDGCTAPVGRPRR
jgi:hypothetical protein